MSARLETVREEVSRKREAEKAVAKLARTNQVLVFNCHPSMAELFTKVSLALPGPSSFTNYTSSQIMNNDI